MNDKLVGKDGDAALCDDEYKDVVAAFLHSSGKHFGVLSSHEAEQVWLMGDGLGKFEAVGDVAATDWDWSHVRDSSPCAIMEMGFKIRSLLAERAHPGKYYCAKCLDSGLHFPDGL